MTTCSRRGNASQGRKRPRLREAAHGVPQPSDCRRAPTHQTFKTRRVDDTIEPCNRARRSGRPARLMSDLLRAGEMLCNPRNDELTLDPYVHLSRCEIARPITQSLSASERKLSSSVKCVMR